MKKLYFLITLFLGTLHFYAQEQELDSIRNENVLVEFSYNPTLTDVFKLKTEPKLNTTHKSVTVNYKINDKQVDSDFTPAAPKAEYVNIDKRAVKIYNNYIYGAAGLYANGELALFLSPKIKKDYEFGIELYSDNYQNGIEDSRVSNAKWETRFKTFLSHNSENLNWRSEILYNRNSIHWYGLNSQITNATLYENLDFNQVYNQIALSGAIDFKNSKVSEITPTIQFFQDAYNSSEIDLKAKVNLDSSLLWDLLETEINVEYLNGKFKQGYTDLTPINYSFINLGIHPKYFYQSESLNVNVGLQLLMNNNIELGNTDFLLLPTATITLPIIKNLMTLEGGVRSSFKQNTYASLVRDNNFVAPNLNILASHNLLDGFIGLNGKLTKIIHYDTEASYQVLNNLALYTHNNSTATFNQSYQLGNSFNVVYRDASLITVKGSMSIDLSSKIKVGGIASYLNYSLENEEQAWNLPNLELESYIQYTSQKYFGQASVNLLGDRKDLINNQETTITGYLDVNLKTGYNFTKKFKAHLNIYNVLNSNYSSFNNYQVQGLQAVAGLSYQF